MEGDTDTEAQLIFMLGGDNADVYVDDVSLTATDEIDPGLELINDRAFDDTAHQCRKLLWGRKRKPMRSSFP